MVRAARTFRVFISSTFTDLKAERNALQERVFPRIQAFCLQRGARFQAIDLRWGVSTEASADQQTINICLDEVRGCQQTSPRPNFIVLLGDRYGWQPPPPQILGEHFDEILNRVPDQGAVDLLTKWYQLDENAVPPEYFLRPRTGDFRDDDAWRPVERQLRAVLEAAVRDMPLEKSDRRAFEASATELEIQQGALRSLPDHVFCYFRSIDFGGGDRPPDHPLLGDFIDLDDADDVDLVASRRLDELKGELRQLPADNVHHYEARWTGDAEPPITTDHIDRLCDAVFDDLIGVITRELDRAEEVEPIEQEVDLHERFGEERARFFTGRVEALGRIADYVAGRESKPLVVVGPGGSGKSAAMARAAQEAAQRFARGVVTRFVGATSDSSNGRTLLEGLCREISRRFRGDESTVPSDYPELVRDFPTRLALASEERPLVVFLDALDQLSATDGAHRLSWLPPVLPPHVRLVVSTLSGEPLQMLERRIPDSSRVELGPMETAEAGELLDRWLQDAGRILQPPQREAVLRRFAAEGRPLWLKLAFEEARLWKSTDAADDLPTTIDALIEDRLLARLEDEANHGEVLVSRSLGFLAAAKNGLSEDEMIDLLSLGGQEGEVLTDFRRRSPRSPEVDRLPVVVWSRLHSDLEPYLTERTADGTFLMGFYHRQLAEAAAGRYLDGEAAQARHRDLAGYFVEQPLRVGGEEPNLRKMSEQPYQQTMGELWDGLFQTLTDFGFLERKAEDMGSVETEDARGNVTRTYTGIHQIREDYALVLARMPGARGGRTGLKDGRRRIVVTGVDFGQGLVLRCPHCNTRHPFQEEWKGQGIACPNPECNGPLRVNPFVVQRRS